MINKKNKNRQFNIFYTAAFCGVLFGVLFGQPVFSEESKAFNLVTVVDNFLNLDGESKSAYESLDEKTRQRQEFIETTRRFNQGNVSVAYNDYSKIISEMDNDIALLVFSKSMYEIGFFTLGDVAISKVKNQPYFQKQIENLQNSYKDNYPLDKQEEIYLAKAYASIYFDNTPEETAFDLSKKSGLLEKSDYANFIMAQALNESRQYQQALMFVDEAVKKNPKNPNYISYKIKILDKAGKSKEALKLLEKYEYSDIVTAEFKNKFLIQKENILANLTNNDNEKKFHMINVIYLEGDYYRVINECQNILNFNKNNYKILTLQAQSQLNTGKGDLAKKNLLLSYDINKKYAPTLASLGDILFMEGKSDDAIEYYKKAMKADKNNLLIKMKLLAAYKNTPGYEKNLISFEKQIKPQIDGKNLFYENYTIAISTLKNNKKLRREYLLKSLEQNLMFEGAQNAYLAYLNENKRQKALQNFLYMISFVNNFNYVHYYYRGIIEMALGNLDLAKINMRHCISLNPFYEPADKFLAEIEKDVM